MNSGARDRPAVALERHRALILGKRPRQRLAFHDDRGRSACHIHLRAVAVHASERDRCARHIRIRRWRVTASHREQPDRGTK
jgi:hypothetical protein